MRPLRLYEENGAVVCEFTLHIDARAAEPEEARKLILEGMDRIAGEYAMADRTVSVKVRVNIAERFSLGAINVRLIDKTPVIRRWYDPRVNVSRAYFGTRRMGLQKLLRFVLRRPDIYINLSGRSISEPAQRAVTCSVIQHEFGHVLGFADKYRPRSFKKKSQAVDDRDIMYRVGNAQGFMEYHIKRLECCAKRGRLPFRNV